MAADLAADAPVAWPACRAPAPAVTLPDPLGAHDHGAHHQGVHHSGAHHSGERHRAGPGPRQRAWAEAVPR